MKKVCILFVCIFVTFQMMASRVSFVGCIYEFEAPWGKISLRFLSEDTCVWEQKLYCPLLERYSHSIDTLLYTVWEVYWGKEPDGDPLDVVIYPSAMNSNDFSDVTLPQYSDAYNFYGTSDILVNGKGKYELQSCENDWASSFLPFGVRYSLIPVQSISSLSMAYPYELIVNRGPKSSRYLLTLREGIPMNTIRNKPIRYKIEEHVFRLDKCFRKKYKRNWYSVTKKDLMGHSFKYTGLFDEEFCFDSEYCIYSQSLGKMLVYEVTCSYEIVDNYVVLHKLSSTPSWMDSGESNMQHWASDSIGKRFPELPEFCTINNITNDTLCYRNGVLLYSKVYLTNKRPFDFHHQETAEMENRAYISTHRKNEPDLTKLFYNIYIPLNYYSPIEDDDVLRSKRDKVLKEREKMFIISWNF